MVLAVPPSASQSKAANSSMLTTLLSSPPFPTRPKCLEHLGHSQLVYSPPCPGQGHSHPVYFTPLLCPQPQSS